MKKDGDPLSCQLKDIQSIVFQTCDAAWVQQPQVSCLGLVGWCKNSPRKSGSAMPRILW